MLKEHVLERIRSMFRNRGDSLYGGEEVTQLEHALQAAMLAEREGAGPALVSAALLHDVGHLMHDLPEDAPDHGVDDVHEQLACDWLSNYFGPDVVEPVRLHVAAKRYLCAVDSRYHDDLSDASRQSLALQGGPFTADEARQFEEHPLFKDCIRLRRWDDLAKVVNLKTPDLEHYLVHVGSVFQAARPLEAAP
jgi:phosphonate degradation associated HDIG domain protein